MNIKLVGIDLAKHYFQVHGVDFNGKGVLKKKFTRKQFIEWLHNLPICIVAMESCSGSQHWGRIAKSLGHEVRIIPAQFVKPFLKSQKNDANDAEAIAECASRPSMRFASVKESWQHEIQSLHRVRERLIHNQTALTNQLRAILEEHGVIMAQGHLALNKKAQEVLSDSTLLISEVLKTLIQDLYSEYLVGVEKLNHYDEKLKYIASTNEACKRLQTIPGVGPKISTAFIAAIGDPAQFKNGRAVAAWLGVVPKQYSSGGNIVLRGITKRGNKQLRALIIHGTRSVILATKTRKIPLNDTMQKWVQKKIVEKHVNVAVVALANKNIRIMWAVLMRGVSYQAKLAA